MCYIKMRERGRSGKKNEGYLVRRPEEEEGVRVGVGPTYVFLFNFFFSNKIIINNKIRNGINVILCHVGTNPETKEKHRDSPS